MPVHRPLGRARGKAQIIGVPKTYHRVATPRATEAIASEHIRLIIVITKAASGEGEARNRIAFERSFMHAIRRQNADLRGVVVAARS